MAIATISVVGMTCDGCVQSVSKAIGSVPGVSKVEVSLDRHLATVEYDSARTSESVLKSAIEDAGYDIG
ncbi:MAG: copper ion binding protein [Alicyclobacillaceae bacterium]|jgi:copper ion binding protein|uniref:heavy-metal-associated domain-containing protein n=1 Tax=Alicyclobacillus sp. SP_1 TaxID=2942475 RepID=UPI0021572390|nr:copper ion binding protein [Alicyclobacillus sp. SP_1]MCY0888829.1 copper ion binding protein [Alicyclobacillaceae bacterium]MCY0897115.1 copper ion binding protein [Alicyclobacillaceae bacterium]